MKAHVGKARGFVLSKELLLCTVNPAILWLGGEIGGCRSVGTCEGEQFVLVKSQLANKSGLRESE